MRDEPLLDAAGRIADGDVVDWPALSTATSPGAARELADELALVARIADGHRRLHQILPLEDTRPLIDRARWGHLDLLNIVGRGSYGTVYRAWDTRLERLVALKVFHRSPHPEVVMREGRMLARIRHENVVTVYGADVIDGVAGIWMEFVHGQTLDQIVRERGPMSAREAATVGLHVARALGAIHGAQLLHCDVKAQNVVRDANGRVVLMDMGAGRPLPEDARAEGDVTGTPRYMAPELFRRGAVSTSATDVYAIGVLLYYLFTGRFPVDGQTYHDLKLAHARGQLRLLDDGPPAFLSIVNRALDPNPAGRPASAQLIEDELTRMVSPRPRVRAWAAAAALFAAVAATAVTWWALATGQPPVKSISVLPIRNLTGDASKAFLAEGLTEVLISNVARVQSFRVRSLTGVAGVSPDGIPPEVAEKYGVDLVLTGSITQADEKFRMAVRLVDARTNQPIWGEEIAREAPGMLAAQADITRFVADRLALTLTAGEQQGLRARAVDPRAQNAYLHGLAIKTQTNLRREAARFFRLATEIDPDFAAAWADLALVEVVLYSDLPLAQRRARSAEIRKMAERAIKIDPTLASGYAALGTILFYDDWDFAGAEMAFKKALAVDASHGLSRQRCAMLFAALGRMPEAIAMAREAVLIEPVVPWRATSLGGVYYYAREFALAEAEAVRADQLSPGFPVALFLRGQIAAADNRLDEGIAFMRKALAANDYAGWLAELVRVSAAAGQVDEARKLLAQLDKRQQEGDTVAPDNRAYLAIAEGRLDDAVAILNHAIDERSQNVLWLKVDPRVDRLRTDPRFPGLLRRIGINP